MFLGSAQYFYATILNSTQLKSVTSQFEMTLAELCTLLQEGTVTEQDLRFELGVAKVSVDIQDRLIACLKDAGIFGK